MYFCVFVGYNLKPAIEIVLQIRNKS